MITAAEGGRYETISGLKVVIIENQFRPRGNHPLIGVVYLPDDRFKLHRWTVAGVSIRDTSLNLNLGVN